jgi:glycosyl transferase family 25
MRAVVINLDRSPERLEIFKAQAETLGIAFERLPAIDAATIREQRGRLTPAEMACFDSHRLAWQLLVDSNEPWLAIFEDDVVLASSLATLLGSDDWIPTATDIVKLETFNALVSIAPDGVSVRGCRLHKLLSTHLGAAGYIISRRWAAELLARTARYDEPVDWILFDLDTDASFAPHILQVIPAPCIQQQWIAHQAGELPRHESLIPRLQGKEELDGRAKFRRELNRIGRQILRLPRTVRKALVPSRQVRIPYQDS